MSFDTFPIGAGANTGGSLGYSLGTAPATVVVPNIQNNVVVFHNPGSSVTIYVCQALDANGNALTAGPNPGCFAIYPGQFLPFNGPGVTKQWNAAAATGSGNPFTVFILQAP